MRQFTCLFEVTTRVLNVFFSKSYAATITNLVIVLWMGPLIKKSE